MLVCNAQVLHDVYIYLCAILQLNKVGLKTDEERRPELCLSRSHEELFDSRIAQQNSPPISKKGSKNRGGGLFKFIQTVMTRGKHGGGRERQPSEGSADEIETQSSGGTSLPSSFSLPNIACEFYCCTSFTTCSCRYHHNTYFSTPKYYVGTCLTDV